MAEQALHLRALAEALARARCQPPSRGIEQRGRDDAAHDCKTVVVQLNLLGARERHRNPHAADAGRRASSAFWAWWWLMPMDVATEPVQPADRARHVGAAAARRYASTCNSRPPIRLPSGAAGPSRAPTGGRCSSRTRVDL